MNTLNEKLRLNAHLSIRWKLVLPLVLVTALVVAFLLPTTSRLVAGRIQSEADRQLAEIARSVSALLENSKRQALLSANFVANLPEVDSAHGDVELLAAVLPVRKDELELQELSFYSADFQPGDPALVYGGPNVAVRFQASARAAEIRDDLIMTVLENGRPASGIAIVPQSSQVIGVSPVRSMGSEGTTEGVIVAAIAIDDLFIGAFRKIVGTDIAIVAENAVIVSTIDRASGYELLLQNNFIDPTGEISSEDIVYGDGTRYRLLAHPLVVDGDFQGTTLVAQPINNLFQVQRDIQLVLFIFAGVVAVTGLLLAVAALLGFARPLARLAVATTKISQGDLSQRVNAPYFLFRDEITDLSENFNNMTSHLQELYASLEQRVERRTQQLLEEHQKLDQALGELSLARDEAVAANQAKSEFVSLVSHELKSPMTTIRGYTDLLLMGASGQLTEHQLDFLQTIRSNTERMRRLVTDLTDISRIESGHLNLEPEAVAINSVVDEVVRSVKGQLEEKKQRLLVQFDDDLPQLWCDSARTIQILTNLLSNAHKYTPVGGEIVLYAEKREIGEDAAQMQEMILIAVRDNGIGISDEDQARLFEKFFRADDEQARSQPGTGLGLNITRNLIEMQGGQVCFESEYGQGTTFYFTLPVADGQKTER